MSWAARAMKPQIPRRMMKESTSSSAEEKGNNVTLITLITLMKMDILQPDLCR